MTENDLLEYILDRLGRSETMEEIFGTDEIQNWPSRIFESLVENGLLRSAEPAKSMICDGCEEYCPMSVNIFPADGNRPARAFIVCDKPADLGRISVSFDRLKQWKITSGLLAKTLSRMLGLDKTPKMELKGKRWSLGILKGRKKKAQTTLALENSVHLRINGHEIPLHEVLRFHQGSLKIDAEEIIRLIDKPSIDWNYKPSTARREQKKKQTQERNEIIRESYREWKGSQPGGKDEWYSAQIAEELKEQGYKISPATVRRNLKK